MSVVSWRSARMTMLPPLPPLPPSGPPFGMNFSRRKLTTPLPPLPALTVMTASSTNMVFGVSGCMGRGGMPGGGARSLRILLHDAADAVDLLLRRRLEGCVDAGTLDDLLVHADRLVKLRHLLVRLAGYVEGRGGPVHLSLPGDEVGDFQEFEDRLLVV